VCFNGADTAAQLTVQMQGHKGRPHGAQLMRFAGQVHRQGRSVVQSMFDGGTRDGQQAVSLLSSRRHVTVFYGHIHQEHHHMTGHIAHHSAKSLIFRILRPCLLLRRYWVTSPSDATFLHKDCVKWK
jgi:hypothetical protein